MPVIYHGVIGPGHELWSDAWLIRTERMTRKQSEELGKKFIESVNAKIAKEKAAKKKAKKS